MGPKEECSAMVAVEYNDEFGPLNLSRDKAWSYAAEAFGFNNHDIRREFADYYAWIEAEGICEWGNQQG